MKWATRRAPVTHTKKTNREEKEKREGKNTSEKNPNEQIQK